MNKLANKIKKPLISIFIILIVVVLIVFVIRSNKNSNIDLKRQVADYLIDIPDDYKEVSISTDKVIKTEYAEMKISGELPQVHFQVGDIWLDTTVVASNQVKPQKNSNKILYQEISPGLDVEYSTYNGYLRQQLIINNQAAEKEITLLTAMSDKAELVDEGGHIKVVDKDTRQEYFMLRHPQGYDADFKAVDFKYRLENNKLIIYPYRQYQLAEARYPIKILPDIQVLAWDEVLIKVGERGPNSEHAKDGDVVAIKPAGWNWGKLDRNQYAIVKVPKLTFKQKLEFEAKGDPNWQNDKELSQVDPMSGSARYGIDYTKFLSKKRLAQVRAHQQENIIDARDEKIAKIFIAKTSPIASALNNDKRLAYQPPKKSSKLAKLWKNIAGSPAKAAGTFVTSIGSGSCGGSCDYSTIDAWENDCGDATSCDLVTNSEIAKGEVYNDSTYTEHVVITAFTSGSSSYFPWLTVAEEERHKGVAGTGVLMDPTTSGHVFEIDDDYVRLEGFEVTDVEGASDEAVRIDDGDNTLIRNFLVYDFTVTNNDGIYMGLDSRTVTIENSIIYNIYRAGIHAQNYTGAYTQTWYIKNCTIYGNGTAGEGESGGISARAEDTNVVNVHVTSTIVLDTASTYDDFEESIGGGGVINWYGDYNISSDTSAPDDGNSIHSASTQDEVLFNSTESGKEDFHITTESIAKNAGTSDSGFVDDIDGDSRPYGDAWDIGADEFSCPDNWWSCQWKYRMKVNIDNSSQSTALSNFPASVQLNSDRIDYDHTQDLGQDVRFVDTNGTTTLQYEIEDWDETATSSLFIKVPEVTAAAVDYVWLYYGNNYATTTATTTGVWDNNFVMVQHMNEAVNTTSNGYIDSTQYSNDGTGVSMALTASTGVSGNAQDFDGSADYITISDTANLRSGTGPFTMEAWFKAPNGSQYGGILDKNTCSLIGVPASNFGISGSDLRSAGDSIASFYGTDGNTNYEDWWPNNDVTDDTWHFAAQTISSSVGSLYLDDNLVSKRNDYGTPNDNNTDPMNIAAFNFSDSCIRQGFFDGMIDEVRVSTTNRSADWLDLTYCNMKDTCMSYGTEQVRGEINTIYRSVGPSNTSAMASGSATTTLTIYNNQAHFTNPLPDRIGVGDVIQYDADNDGTIDNLAFIHERIDWQNYKVRNASGTNTTLTSVADSDWAIFRAYTSLSNAETGTENTGISSGLRDFDAWVSGKDIAAANEQWNIALYGDAADTSGVTIDGWNTSVDNFIRLYTPYLDSEVGISQRHHGKWTTSAYRLIISTAWSRAIYLYENNVRIDGLQIEQQQTTGDMSGIFTNSGLNSQDIDLRLSNNLLKGSSTSDTSHIGISIVSAGDGSNVEIWNNIVYDWYLGIEAAPWSNADDSDWVIYNNTVIDCVTDGIAVAFENSSSTAHMYNNLAQGNTTDYDLYGTANLDIWSNSNNLAEDTSSPNDTYDSQVVTFASSTLDDFRLSPWDTAAIDNASSTFATTTTFYFTNDIINSIRPIGNAWDIGAHEVATGTPTHIYRSSGPGNTSAVASTTASNISLKIFNNVAYFSANLPDNVGVGDALQYDATGDGSIDSIAFISGRNSASSFTVKDFEGNSATSTMTIDGDLDWGIYRSYSSLSNAETGTENTGLNDGVQYFENWSTGRDIKNLNEIWNIALYSDGYETDTVTIDGWTTAISTYLYIYTPFDQSEVGASQRHEGVWNSNKYYITHTDPSGGVILVRDDYTWIDGLQVYNNYSGVSTNRFAIGLGYADSCNYCKLSNSILRGADNTEDRGLYANSEGVEIWNNIVYDFARYGIHTYFDSLSGNPHRVYNNTVYNAGDYCFGSNEDYKVNPILINNIAQNCTDGYYNYYDTDSDYNVSDISSDAPGSNSVVGNVLFSNEAQDDFRLDPADTVAKDNATSSPATDTNLSFTTDIEDVYRLDPWDIGADEAGFKFPVKIKGGMKIKGGIKLK